MQIHDSLLQWLQKWAKGRERAAKAWELAQALGVSTRQVRAAVHDLRRAGHPIASAVEPPTGFYLPTTVEEADACSRHLWARVRETAEVARAFDRAAARLGLTRTLRDQVRFVFGDEPRREAMSK